MHRYTKEQLDFIKKAYMSMTVMDLARAFNTEFGTSLKHQAISGTLKRYGIKCGRKGAERLTRYRSFYTDEMISFLEKGYKTLSLHELTTSFNARFDLNKSEDSINSALGNRGITSGRTGRFEKGDQPWNSGSKGKRLTTANRGTFKKGNKPANRKPIGSERICSKDGYVLVKVAERDPHTGFPTRYKHKHVHIYEQLHGEVPSGMVVIFRDGNTRNFDSENLVLVKRNELLRLNHHKYKKAPDELKGSVMALSRLEVRMFEKRKGL